MGDNLPLIIFIGLSTGFIVALIAYTLFRFYVWSAITLAIIVAYVIINIMYPIGELFMEKESYVIAIYLLIEIIVPIYLFGILIVMLYIFARCSTPCEGQDLSQQIDRMRRLDFQDFRKWGQH